MYIKEFTKVIKKVILMLVKKNKLKNVVNAFGKSGALVQGGTGLFSQKFRSFSVFNNTGACTVGVNGSNVGVPVGVTVTWDAPIEESVINRYDSKTFDVGCADCIVVGTV